MRTVIAQRLVESKGPVPHFYLTIDVDAGPLMSARAELKSAGQGADAAKITVNDFVLKAAVQAAVKVPKANASFDGDAIMQYADVDLAIAVAIEDGLVTPVLRAAQNEIAPRNQRSGQGPGESRAQQANEARRISRRFVSPFQTSAAMESTVSRPSSIRRRASFSRSARSPNSPVVDESDQIVIGHRMSICMSCDHRVIDGALGADYLKELRHFLENPTLLLV